MKKLVLLLGALAVTSTALAGETKKTIPCAVMPDHKVNIEKATKDKMFADHKGRRYFFCCGGCVPTFKKNPDKFAKADSIPTPKAKTKG